MVRVNGEPAVLSAIEFELTHLALLMNVGGNLNNFQIQFIAKQLLEKFPNESIADFKLCFERGAMGAYGQIQRMDGITLSLWIEKYLEEKYDALVDRLAKEKDELYKPVQVPEHPVADFDFDSWLKSVKEIEVKTVRGLTKEEIAIEGKEKVGTGYKFNVDEASVKIMEHYRKLFQWQEQTVRERHPDFSEQQIADRCLALKKESVKKEPAWLKKSLGL